MNSSGSKSSGSKSSGKSSGKSSSSGSKRVSALIKIENILPGNEYFNLYAIYLFIKEKKPSLSGSGSRSDGNESSKIFGFLKNKNVYKLKEEIIKSYYQLSEADQKKVNKYVFSLNENSLKENLGTNVGILLKDSLFDNLFIVNVYFYLSKVLFNKNKKKSENTYAFLDDFHFELFSSNKKKKELINEIKIAFMNDDYYFCKELYFKILTYMYLMKMKRSHKYPEYVIFNNLFMDVISFMKKDPRMRLILYYLMTDSYTILEPKVIDILKVIIPFVKTEQSEDKLNEKRNKWYRYTVFKPLPYIYTEVDLDYIEDIEEIEDIIAIFMKFICNFYMNTIYYKYYNKLKKTDEIIIRKILKIIITILKDDNYEYEKYEKEFEYIRNNNDTPDFFYYYSISLIMDTKEDDPAIQYFNDFNKNKIESLPNYKTSFSFPLSTATSREEFTRELTRGSTVRETLTEQEKNRYRPSMLYLNQYGERFEESSKEIKYIFLRIIRNYYMSEVKKGTDILLIHDYLNENVVIPITQE